MSQLSSRDKGGKLEVYAASVLNMDLTKNSGATRDDSDLQDEHFLAECKVKGTVTGVSVTRRELSKVAKQATNWHKQSIMVMENGNQERHVIIDLDVFADIYNTYKQWLKHDGI